jgi:hypothetical protein
MIRLKQIGAALQILSVFAQLSSVLSPWFKEVVGALLTISVPVEVEPVCASWFSTLIHGEYYFIRAYIALAILSTITVSLRFAHKITALKGRISLETFANMQKGAALIVINTPIIVLPLALRPAQMRTSYFEKFHFEEDDREFSWFNAFTSGFFLSLVSIAILIFVLHRTIKVTSSQFKVLRVEVLKELVGGPTSGTAITWEDIYKSRPYVAAFCQQYTVCVSP